MRVAKIVIIVVLIILLTSYAFALKYLKNQPKQNQSNKNHQENIQVNADVSKYNEYMSAKYNESELTPELKTEIEELDKYLKKYKVSVCYEDLTTGFSYEYDADREWYGASLIKLVESMYLIDNATAGKIDLNEKIKYIKKYKAGYSEKMKDIKIGEEVTILELINYSMTYSDNSAHYMISDYIGLTELRKYGESLGGTVILKGGDTFGFQTANDTNKYLKHAYEIMETNEKYGSLLKQYMLNDYYNFLNLEEENNVAHKFGIFDEVYHDIGIVFTERPYTISVLTGYGEKNCKEKKYEEVVKQVHEKIAKLHKDFYDNRVSKYYE